MIIAQTHFHTVQDKILETQLHQEPIARKSLDRLKLRKEL
jgi:hypothetical protein